jgi:hypothetical protein
MADNIVSGPQDAGLTSGRRLSAPNNYWTSREIKKRKVRRLLEMSQTLGAGKVIFLPVANAQQVRWIYAAARLISTANSG